MCFIHEIVDEGRQLLSGVRTKFCCSRNYFDIRALIGLVPVDTLRIKIGLKLHYDRSDLGETLQNPQDVLQQTCVNIMLPNGSSQG